MIRNQVTECRRLGVTIQYGVRCGRDSSPNAARTRIVATGAEPQRPWWVQGDAANVADVRDVLEGTVRPTGR